jgi:hypothetical protein
MTRVRIDGRGVFQEGGSGFYVEQNELNYGFGPYAMVVTPLTTASILTTPGVYTLSSSTTPVVVTMPSASAVPGAQFIFRSLSAHFHDLTGSQEVALTKVFCHDGQLSGSLITGSSQGSRLELRNVEGSSVFLVSDGTNYLVTASSGSIGLFAP